MDGDICPLKELIDVGKRFCNAKGDIQFIVDEAHSVGVIGPNGSGLVCYLGLLPWSGEGSCGRRSFLWKGHGIYWRYVPIISRL
jgi:7-keto-8-aminopelargonate synthetase-like enzyme